MGHHTNCTCNFGQPIILKASQNKEIYIYGNIFSKGSLSHFIGMLIHFIPDSVLIGYLVFISCTGYCYCYRLGTGSLLSCFLGYVSWNGYWTSPYKTCSSPRRAVPSHSLVCSENYLLIVGIKPSLNKELELIFRSDRSYRTCVYS